MDHPSRKRLKRLLREQERDAGRRALPLDVTELDAMFEALAQELSRQACDDSRRLTKAWLATRGYDVDVVFRWLDEHNGFCDCEVLANTREHFNEVKCRAPTPPS